MDHIPLPSDDWAHSPLEVPFLEIGPFGFDGGDFHGFPNRVGVDVDLLAEDECPNLSLQNSAQFLQAWMWFALLREHLGFCSSDRKSVWLAIFGGFVKLIGDRKYLSMEAFRQLTARARSMTNDSQSARRRRIASCIRKVGSFVHTVVKTPFIHSILRIDGPTSERHKVFLVLLAVQILCQEIENDFTSLGTALTYPSGASMLADFPHDLLDSLLVQAGWRPHAIQRLPRHASLRYYLSFYRAERPWKDISRRESIDKKGTYIPRHTHETCRCEPIEVGPPVDCDSSPDTTAVIVNFRKTTLGTRVLENETINLSTDSSSRFFVAISHVRGAGLGNTSKNSLPFCQVALIQTLANQLSAGSGENTPFWIDTLCLPRDRVARNIAKRQMRKVFERANVVLVLDPPLFRHTIASPQEALVRIRFSPWISRLWTLGEALYASQLIFKFSNTMVSLDWLLQEFQRTLRENPAELIPGFESHGSFLRPDEDALLPELLSRFSDDIHEVSRVGPTRPESLKTHGLDEFALYEILRCGYLLARKFRYFIDDDEARLSHEVWSLLVKTYGSSELRHPSRTMDAVARLRNMKLQTRTSRGNRV